MLIQEKRQRYVRCAAERDIVTAFPSVAVALKAVFHRCPAHSVYRAFKNIKLVGMWKRHIESISLVAPGAVHAEAAMSSPERSETGLAMFVTADENDVPALILVQNPFLNKLIDHIAVNAALFSEVVVDIPGKPRFFRKQESSFS